jgi:hypothetical protein
MALIAASTGVYDSYLRPSATCLVSSPPPDGRHQACYSPKVVVPINGIANLK